MEVPLRNVIWRFEDGAWIGKCAQCPVETAPVNDPNPRTRPKCVHQEG